MSRHNILGVFLFLLGQALPLSAETIDGVFVWVDGSATCYLLEEEPTVALSLNAEGKEQAELLLGSSATPELTLLLDGHELEVTFGTYLYAKTNASGFGTFSFSEAVRFPGDINTYLGQTHLNNTYVKLIECDKSIPAYSGIIIQGEKNQVVPLTIIPSANALSTSNELKPTTVEEGLASVNKSSYPYVLSGNKFVMYKGTSFPANRAFLPGSVVNDARVESLSLGDGEEETPVRKVAKDAAVQKCGKYICGGRVIVVKNGKRYDLNGTVIE